VFRGVYEHQIDSKGRTSFPSKMREILLASSEDKLIVTTALDACLHAYPLKEWEQLEQALGKRNPMELGVKTLMRLYIANAQECPLDRLGRILLPQALRSHARLEKEVLWVGMVRLIELWCKEGWQEAQREAREAVESASLLNVLAELRRS